MSQPLYLLEREANLLWSPMGLVPTMVHIRGVERLTRIMIGHM